MATASNTDDIKFENLKVEESTATNSEATAATTKEKAAKPKKDKPKQEKPKQEKPKQEKQQPAVVEAPPEELDFNRTAEEVEKALNQWSQQPLTLNQPKPDEKL
jgi:hypothetical protein